MRKRYMPLIAVVIGATNIFAHCFGPDIPNGEACDDSSMRGTGACGPNPNRQPAPAPASSSSEAPAAAAGT